MARCSFDKKSFLKKGAIFGSGETFHLFWGEETLEDIRPDGPCLSVMDYFATDVRWKSFEKYTVFNREELKSHFNSEKQSFHWQSAGKEKFFNMFSQVQNAISAKKVEKLVPYTLNLAELEEESISLDLFIGSALNHTMGYLYGDWADDSGFLGLTPEYLVKASGEKLSTMALAGTCEIEAFKKNPNNFLNNQKEVQEHQKVVDDLVMQLQKFGVVKLFERETLETPNLVHLKTSIELEDFHTDPEEIVLKLHPTPALGSFPRTEGTGYLVEWNEFIPRGIFGAPFGFSLNSEDFVFLVAIRNLIWESRKLKIFSGCGIVEASQFEQEWQELQNKFNSVKAIFGIL